METPKRALPIVAVLVLVTSAFIPVSASDAASAPTLRDLADQTGILIGSGDINPNNFSDPQFGPMLAQQFNSLSPENELKWAFNEPQQGVFDFTKLDQLANFATQNNMVMK